MFSNLYVVPEDGIKKQRKKRDRNYTDAQEKHSFQFHLGSDQLAYSLESLCNFSKYITQVIIIYMILQKKIIIIIYLKTAQKHH